jgi:uncharacterized damage-inducible protein DinB
MEPTKDLFVKMVMMAWESQNSRTTKLISGLTDEQLMLEVAPGRNRGIYLLGHLIAVNDALLATLGTGARQFQHYDDAFLKNPDKTGKDMPALSTLRDNWNQTTATLKASFEKLSADDWFRRHTAVSEEDFAREPHRNRLNVLMSRTSHEAYHQGQLALLQKK